MEGISFLGGSMSELLFGLAELPERPVVIQINAGLGGLARHLPQGSTFMGYEDWELAQTTLVLGGP